MKKAEMKKVQDFVIVVCKDFARNIADAVEKGQEAIFDYTGTLEFCKEVLGVPDLGIGLTQMKDIVLKELKRLEKEKRISITSTHIVNRDGRVKVLYELKKTEEQNKKELQQALREACKRMASDIANAAEKDKETLIDYAKTLNAWKQTFGVSNVEITTMEMADIVRRELARLAEEKGITIINAHLIGDDGTMLGSYSLKK